MRSARRLPPVITRRTCRARASTAATACAAPISDRSSRNPTSSESSPPPARNLPFSSEGDLLDATAQALADEKAVGWFQGRMEFGPRALGARSILGDPRSPAMQKMLNLKVKYRESFRPFAPSVLREDVADWFEMDADSPYMLLVAPVKKSRQRAMSEAEQASYSASTSSTCRARTFRR